MNGATWALARMNMFLHSKDAARIEWCDTLNSPTLIEDDQLMKFDVVVANPPFSLDKWGAENAEQRSVQPVLARHPAQVQGRLRLHHPHDRDRRAKSGRVAVIVPHGVLFRGGSEGQIRQALIEENLLDAVVGLPANLFTTTGIPVAILVFDRSREQGGANEERKDILFIDASQEFTPGKTQNLMTDEHIQKVLDTYRTRAEIDKYSHRATPEEITENEFNLNIPRYVDTFEPEEEIDVAALQKEINRLEGELAEVGAAWPATSRSWASMSNGELFLLKHSCGDWLVARRSSALTSYEVRDGRSPYVRVANVFDGYIDFVYLNRMPFKPKEIVKLPTKARRYFAQ